jgi:hypothetical protein
MTRIGPHHYVVAGALMSLAAAGTWALILPRSTPPPSTKGGLAGPRPPPRITRVIPIDRQAPELPEAPALPEPQSALSPAPPPAETAAVNVPIAALPPPRVDAPADDDDALTMPRIEIAHVGDGNLCSHHGGRRADFKHGRRMAWRCVYRR